MSLELIRSHRALQEKENNSMKGIEKRWYALIIVKEMHSSYHAISTLE